MDDELDMTVRESQVNANPTDTRQGVCLGSGIGNLEELYDTSIAYNEGVSRRPCQDPTQID